MKKNYHFIVLLALFIIIGITVLIASREETIVVPASDVVKPHYPYGDENDKG
jgi:hypothetical protein